MEEVLHRSNIQGVGTLSVEWTEKAEGGEEPLEGAPAQRAVKRHPLRFIPLPPGKGGVESQGRRHRQRAFPGL